MKKPHIHLEPDERYSRVLVCGAPERAALIAESLQEATPVAKNREYHSYLGKHAGKYILVVSHGVGAAGAAICFQELIDVGAKVILRLGTAGGLQDGLTTGGTVLATAAIRKDGTSRAMIPQGFPAVADHELVSTLSHELRTAGIKYHSGIVLSSDLFYPGLLNPKWAFYQKANAIAVEMECSALFVVGSLRRVKTAAVLALDGNPLKWDKGDYAPGSPKLEQAIRAAIPACLNALVKESIE